LLLTCRSHSEYQQFLRKWVPLLWAEDPKRIESFDKPLSKLWLLNLDPAIPLMRAYFPSIGRPVEFDPIDFLRSLVLMADQKVFGITEWVEKLCSDRILAVLSGFKPHEIPSVGAFYDFLNRFWLEDKDTQRKRRWQLKNPLRKPRKKLKAGEKLPPKHLVLLKSLPNRF